MKMKMLFFFFFLLTSGSVLSAEDVLTWDDCVKEARLNHPDLISAREKINQAETTKKETISPMLPQIGSGFNLGTSQSDPSEKMNNYSFNINAKQMIFDGLKTIYGIKASSEYVKSAQFNYESVSASVRSRLRIAFVQLLKSQELLAITQDITERRKKNLELVRISYNAGRENKGSLLTSEANLAQAEFEMTQAKRSIELYQRQLLKELGRDKFIPVQVKGEFQVSSTNRQEPLFGEIADQNPSLLSLMAQTESARYNLSSAKASFFPQIYASGSYGRTSTVWPPDQNQWSLGLSLSLPLFQGGSRLAEIARTKSVIVQLQADEKSTKQSIALNLQQNWLNLQNAMDNIIVQEKFLEATEERAKIAQAEYAIGLVSFDNWTIIEDNLASAKLSYLDSEANILISEANWILAKGGTLDEK